MTPAGLATLHAKAFTDQRGWSAAEFKALLAAPQTLLCAHEHAFILGRLVADEAEILTLVTDPHYQRQGLGHDRLLEFEEAALEHGADHAFLEVAADNKAALSLYENAGYQEVGRRRAYYVTNSGVRQDALVLKKRLSRA